MFGDAKPQLEQILALVKLCPENLQEKCFELLLNAYLAKGKAPAAAPAEPLRNTKEEADENEKTYVIPEAIKTRFMSLASRTKVSVDKAAELFDFNADPFTYHALVVPGTSKAERMKNLALMLALKSYLTTTAWTADWKEFRAACIDHGCWDQGNAPSIMKNDWFKNASAATDITLTSSGTKAAEALFAKLAGVTEETSK